MLNKIANKLDYIKGQKRNIGIAMMFLAMVLGSQGIGADSETLSNAVMQIVEGLGMVVAGVGVFVALFRDEKKKTKK